MSNESSSFSSLSRIPILTGSTDYARWSLVIKNAAMMADVWEYLDGTETYPKVAAKDHKPVIVMTFWYVFGTDLYFFELFKLYFHLGLITTPHVLYVHMTYVYSFFLMFHSSHDHMAKRSHYCIMIFY